jgi:hypothetical protein
MYASFDACRRISGDQIRRRFVQMQGNSHPILAVVMLSSEGFSQSPGFRDSASIPAYTIICVGQILHFKFARRNVRPAKRDIFVGQITEFYQQGTQPGKEEPPQIFVGRIAEFYQGTHWKTNEAVDMNSFWEMQNEMIWESMVHRRNNPVCCL